MGPIFRRPRHGRVGRGDLPLNLCFDQPKSDGGGRPRKRADLDLQINLLAEHEVTKLVTLTSAIARQMGVKTEIDAEVNELARDVAPEQVLDEIEQAKPR